MDNDTGMPGDPSPATGGTPAPPPPSLAGSEPDSVETKNPVQAPINAPAICGRFTAGNPANPPCALPAGHTGHHRSNLDGWIPPPPKPEKPKRPPGRPPKDPNAASPNTQPGGGGRYERHPFNYLKHRLLKELEYLKLTQDTRALDEEERKSLVALSRELVRVTEAGAAIVIRPADLPKLRSTTLAALVKDLGLKEAKHDEDEDEGV